MPRRILVVEDDLLVRRSVERILMRGGYDVSAVPDVGDALAEAERLRFDLALVDYELFDSDGLQVLAQLRESQPTCLRILMTGRTDFPIVVEAVNRGEVLRVLRKPFESSGLLATLADAFASAERSAEVVTASQRARDRHERQLVDQILGEDRVRMALQPIVDARPPHGRVAFEALLRPQHDEVRSPLELLRMARAHRRLHDVGRLVFTRSADWLEGMPRHLGLFVNLAAEQLSDPTRLRDDLAPLVPWSDRVTMEITEEENVTHLASWEASVTVLHDAGFSIAVDDLGAGYNSLSILADLQPRYIKLDMSLVRNVHIEPRKQRLVQLMATFADATNSLVIGEGVEVVEEARQLLACGVHLLQGWHFGKPSLQPDFGTPLTNGADHATPAARAISGGTARSGAG